MKATKYGMVFALAVTVFAAQAEVLKITNETNVPIKMSIEFRVYGNGGSYTPVLNSQGSKYTSADLPLPLTRITIVAEQLGQNILLSGYRPSGNDTWVTSPETLAIKKAPKGTVSVAEQAEKTGTDWKIVLDVDNKLKIEKAS